ncbi:MAG: cytoplasmic protein [Pseudomonadota bacterium]
MSTHSHEFVEHYDGLVGFGADRPTDEATVMVYLQKFSDDTLLRHLIGRLTDGELSEVFDLVNRLMVAHFTEEEYHRLFLKDDHHH